MITQEQIKACKLTLLKRQHELIQKVNENSPYSSVDNSTESLSELSTYDNHPGDLGTELFERGKDLAFKSRSEQELMKINSALHAIDEGTYGLCSVCGSAIPFERLLAVPYTAYCTEHAKRDLDLDQRPVEEQVLSPNINPRHQATDDEVGYDQEDAWQEVSKYGTSETPSDLYGDQEDYNEMYPNADESIGIVEGIEAIADDDPS